MWCLQSPDVIQSRRISQHVQPQTVSDYSFQKTPKIIVPHIVATPSWVWEVVLHFFHFQNIWSLFSVCHPHCLKALNLVLSFVANSVVSTQAVQAFMLFFFFSFPIQSVKYSEYSLGKSRRAKKEFCGKWKRTNIDEKDVRWKRYLLRMKTQELGELDEGSTCQRREQGGISHTKKNVNHSWIKAWQISFYIFLHCFAHELSAVLL